jgi:hypothetical protein
VNKTGESPMNQKQKAYPSITWSQTVALATQTGIKAFFSEHFA